MHARTNLATLIALLGTANAHSIFQRLYVNGVDQGHMAGIRIPTSNSPITDVTSNDVICNNPLVSPFPSAVINIPAGASVTGEWHHGLQANGMNPSDGDDPIASSHKGPIMVYLAKVSDAHQTSMTGLGWFKIFEDGLSGSTWAVDKLIANGGKFSFTVPSCIPSGNYFLRAEIIALHPAATYPGAQLYMACAQINITGGGSSSPATVSFPGAYKGTDPGIKFNLYSTPPPSSYTIPGPRPFTCGGTQPPASSAKPATSSARPASSSARPASSSQGGTTGTVPKYGQCGGQGYTGPTQCAAGSTCTVSNQYYSQCL